MERPILWPAPGRRPSVGPSEHERQGTEHEQRHTKCQADRDESHLPPRPPFLDVIGAVQGADNRHQCRGTAPERADHAERQQSAVFIVRDPAHLVLNEFEHLRRDERTRATRAESSVRFESGKKLASASKNRMAGNSARKTVVRQLCREAEDIIVEGFPGGALGPVPTRTAGVRRARRDDVQTLSRSHAHSISSSLRHP